MICQLFFDDDVDVFVVVFHEEIDARHLLHRLGRGVEQAEGFAVFGILLFVVGNLLFEFAVFLQQEEEIEKTVVVDKAYNDNEEKRGQPAAAGPEEVEEAKKALHEMGLRGRVVASGIRRAFQTWCRDGRSWHRGRC